MDQGEGGPLVKFRMEAEKELEITLIPSLEEVAQHVQTIEKVLATTPIVGFALANELRRAGLKPLEIIAQRR